MKRVLLTAVALLFGAAAFAQPSASVETLARKYADRDGALVMRLDSTMVGLVKLRVAALPDSLRRSAALLDKVSGMTNIMLMTGLARTLDPAADTTAFVRLESDFRADVAALTAEPVRRRLFRGGGRGGRGLLLGRTFGRGRTGAGRFGRRQRGAVRARRPFRRGGGPASGDDAARAAARSRRYAIGPDGRRNGKTSPSFPRVVKNRYFCAT